MNELLETLRRLGLPSGEIAEIEKRFENDLDGLTMYALYVRAELDDRHEYLA